MNNSTVNNFPSCTAQCRSAEHGDIITAAVSKRAVSDVDLCAFLNYTCTRCESVFDSDGRTALHMAASCGRLELVRWLICKRHADIDVKDRESGYTALHRSIFYGKIHVALELIKLGASTTEVDFDSLTVLEHVLKDGLKPNNNCGGELYSWGTNANNLLGPQGARETPELLDVFHKRYPKECVQQICIDQFHSMVVTISGKVYSCGHGQGGRLGLGDERAVITPTLIYFPDTQKCETVICVQASIARDHSIFLCSDGNIYTCGLNTYRVLGQSPPPDQVLIPKQLKHLSIKIEGVCASRYHSVAWGQKGLYVWGLNAGQLGPKINNKDDQFILTPKYVNIVKDINIKAVAASSGATAVCTQKGDVYVLHEYLCRKIASRQLNIVQISIIGGKLDSSLFDRELSKEFNKELKVVLLTNTGNILLWQETDQQLCRCIFSISRAIIVQEVKVNLNGILFVTDHGEAFKGDIRPRKKKFVNTCEKPQKSNEKSAFHKFLEKEECVLLVLQRIPKIHRAISIESDAKGKDFCVIQAYPYKFYEFPSIVESEMQKNFQTLLEEVDQSDNIHDIMFKIEDKYFPAHKYIICTHSAYLERKIQENDAEVIVLNDVNPDIFEQFLLFIYTGSCDLTKCGELKNEGLRNLCHLKSTRENDTVEDLDNLSNVSTFDYHQIKAKLTKNDEQKLGNKMNKNPVRMLHEIAKRFECLSLQKILSNLDMQNYQITYKFKHNVFTRPVKFNRSDFPNLYDIIVKCADNQELKAHKCILAARLEYFGNMFSARWQVNGKSDVTLSVPKNVAEALLDFIYTDSISSLNTADPEYVFKILILADQLFVTRLKEQCELWLMKLLTLKNVVQILTLADLYNAKKLKCCCIKFVILNFTVFWESKALKNLEDELLKEMAEFYFQEKQELWCRVITPYSTAPLDEDVIFISSLYPISLENEIIVETPSVKSNHKRRPRSHKTSHSEKNNLIMLDHVSSDNVIQFPDTVEMVAAPTESCDSIPSRLKSINLATEVIKSEEVEFQFSKLSTKESLNSSELSTSFTDSFEFPELNSPPAHCYQRTTPQKSDSKHKIVRLSQKQRKRLSSESNDANKNLTVAESPKNPWKTIPTLSSSPILSPNSNFTINNIISDEKKQKENLVKITSKLLVWTQVEDRAIDELHKFYNTDSVVDEIILIERVAIGAIASPVWVPRSK